MCDSINFGEIQTSATNTMLKYIHDRPAFDNLGITIITKVLLAGADIK